MTYHWDFFGPRAKGTADHFKIHLDEFLKAKGLGEWESGTDSSGPGHSEVFCRKGLDSEGDGGDGEELGGEAVEDEGAALIKQLLRPKRES